MNAKAMIVVLLCMVVACERDDDQRMPGQLASDRLELDAEFAEPVIARPVAEGARVARGEVLIEQDTTRIDARVSEAQAVLQEFRARLDELTRGPRREQIEAARASVDGARRDVAFQRLEYQRARDVLEKKLAAPESVDRAQAALDTAEAALAVHEAQLDELLTGTTVEELQQAEQRVEQAAARLDGLQTDRARHRLLAPRDGVVDSLLVEAGERPQPGEPLLVLLTGTQPYVRVYVREADRVHVAPGTRARVHVDGLQHTLDGRVRWVSSDAAFTPYFALTEHDRGRLTYAAKIDLDYDGKRLPDGVPVDVELLHDTR